MVLSGLDRLLADPRALKGRRVGLIVNQTSVSRELEYSWNLLRKKGILLKRIFSPEHGLFATEQDQIAVTSQPELECELVSLYGEAANSLIPDPSLLEGLDVVLFDIQDVGSRYYTYVNTLALFMEAAAGSSLQLLVLDRPNPLDGLHVEGPLLDDTHTSFVGIFPVPVRHGLTPGELALLYRAEKALDVDVQIVPMEGWQRSMLFSETGLPWVPPSPNMPTPATAMVYPGMCLFEGLNVSEGRGTTTPFQLFGAPFIEPYRLQEQCAGLGLEGVLFRPHWFRPTFNKYAGMTIGGLWQEVTDAESYRSFTTAVAITALLHDLYPADLRFLHGVYEFDDRFPAFDLLAGSSRIREAVEQGASLSSLQSLWSAEEAQFLQCKERFHMY